MCKVTKHGNKLYTGVFIFYRSSPGARDTCLCMQINWGRKFEDKAQSLGKRAIGGSFRVFVYEKIILSREAIKAN